MAAYQGIIGIERGLRSVGPPSIGLVLRDDDGAQGLFSVIVVDMSDVTVVTVATPGRVIVFLQLGRHCREMGDIVKSSGEVGGWGEGRGEKVERFGWVRPSI